MVMIAKSLKNKKRNTKVNQTTGITVLDYFSSELLAKPFTVQSTVDTLYFCCIKSINYYNSFPLKIPFLPFKMLLLSDSMGQNIQ